MVLGSNHLEYSMLAFVNHLFKGSNESKIREDYLRKQFNKSQSMMKPGLCQHQKKTRVFEMGDKSVKIYIDRFTMNRECSLTHTGRTNFLADK